MNHPSTSHRPLRERMRIRAFAHRFLFAVAVLVTAVALVCMEENWRAARAWTACKRLMVTRGERLDLAAAYDPLPPEHNLARAPLFTHSFEYSVDAASGLVSFSPGTKYRLAQLNSMPAASEDDASPTVFNVYQGERMDLRAWQASYRQHPADFDLTPVADGAPLPAPAEDVLRALAAFSPVLDDVERSAEVMPKGIFALAPTSYSGGAFVAFRRIAQTLALRADAHLALSQSAQARHDLELIFWLRQATASQPRFFRNAAMGCIYLDLALQVVWEGLADHRWTADDLATIQGHLKSMDLLADYRRTTSGQLAEFLFLTDCLLDGRYKYADLFGPDDGWDARVSAWALRRGPAGWLVQNRVRMTRFFQDYLLECVDVPAHRIRPERMGACLAELNRTLAPPVWPWQCVMAAGMPGFVRVAERSALAQTALDEAVAACALERYALAHSGNAPANLNALVPEYLDRVSTSVVDGTPLRYTPTLEGRCRLAARLPLFPETQKPGGSMAQGDDLVWGYSSP